MLMLIVKHQALLLSNPWFIVLISNQRRDEGGVSTQEEVPGCWREENAWHPVQEHVQDPAEGKKNIKLKLE